MSNVVTFPTVSTQCTGRTVEWSSHAEARAKAWANYYASERTSGIDPETAYTRAEEFVTRHFDAVIQDITRIMAEG